MKIVLSPVRFRYAVLLGALSVLFTSRAQVTIYTENMGSPSGTVAITANNFQQEPAITYSGTADVRNTTVSTGYTGSSGGGNVFFTASGRFFLISGINTTGFSSIEMSFGMHKSTIASNNELTVEVSSDGTNFTALSYTRPTGSGTAVWRLITPAGTIPQTANLRIRFTNNSPSAQFRVDDVRVTGVSSLSVELDDFDGKNTPEGMLLSWRTLSEENADYFAVEHADYTAQFTELTRIACAGDSKVPLHYSFTHRTPVIGINYYRLKQVDFNGDFFYSPIIALTHEAEDFGVHYLPEQQQLSFSQELKSGTQIALYQNNGQLVHAITITAKQTSIPLELAAGMWLVRTLEPNGQSHFSRFVAW